MLQSIQNEPENRNRKSKSTNELGNRNGKSKLEIKIAWNVLVNWNCIFDFLDSG